MMITTEDRKNLDARMGKKGAIAQWVFLCATFFELCIAGLYLYLMGLWGSMGGYSFSRTMSLITGGISPDHTYSGMLFKANDSLTSSVIHLCVGIAFAGAWWHGRRAREQAQRIINALNKAGAW